MLNQTTWPYCTAEHSKHSPIHFYLRTNSGYPECHKITSSASLMSKQDHFSTDQCDIQEFYICPNIIIWVLAVAYLKLPVLFFSWRNLETNLVCLSMIRVGRICTWTEFSPSVFGFPLLISNLPLLRSNLPPRDKPDQTVHQHILGH